jgi:hypothetical protein
MGGGFLSGSLTGQKCPPLLNSVTLFALAFAEHRPDRGQQQ